MDEIDAKLMKKFNDMMAEKPLNAQALEFWSRLSKEEYERLIYLFENNKTENMPDSVRSKLVGIFKELKARLHGK